MFEQHPLVPLIFSVILLIVLIKQCFIKHRFLKIKTILTAVIIFLLVMILVFYNNIGQEGTWLEKVNKEYIYWTLAGFDVVIGILFITTIEFSYTNEKLQQELTKSLNDSKYFVVLDKKDRVKNISQLFLDDLEITFDEAYKQNIFDLIEIKYRIVEFNGEECYKADIQKYYSHYETKVSKDQKKTIELTIQDDHAKESALYFYESLIFSSEQYKGRILMGEKKSEENLIGMEKDLAETSNELELIKDRFVTILGKTSEGIFFNNITQGSIWCNDVLVKRLSLNGNSLTSKEFYSMIHPQDLALYEERMKNLPADYSISYRFSTGSSYVCIKEVGHKIVLGKTIELCGIMTPEDDYSFAKTNSILDDIKGEPEMLAKLAGLEKEEKIFEVVFLKVASIPAINEQYGRAIGNSLLAQYIAFFMQNFVTDKMIYRVSGLEFVAFITDYRKMDILKSNLTNGEKILHVPANYLNQTVVTEVFMGIARSDDLPSRKDTLKNAKEALRICSNEKFNSNYAFFKEIR